MPAEPPLKCFVISPIGEEGSPEHAHAEKVLKYLIRKALGETYEVQRGDENANPGAITPQIISAILEADLVIADISGLNANVFYELAIAHGYSRPTIHIQQKGEKAPFDIKDLRLVRYNITDPEELEQAQKQLAKYASYASSNPGNLETPLSNAQRFTSVADSTDPVAESNVRVMEAIGELSKDVKRVLRRAAPSRLAAPTKLSELRADAESLRTIVDRVVSRDAAIIGDFAEVITMSTSTSFDDWARQTANVLDPFAIDVEAAIIDPEVAAQREPADDESDADPF